jgi:small subunit ribosomal protein S4e
MKLGKRGKTGRLKRNPSPEFWPIHRKEFTWVVKPVAGPHSLDNCLSLTLVLRDILGVAKTKKEVDMILSEGRVIVDGKVRRKANFPVGLMDVISLPDLNKFYRVSPSHKGLSLNPISNKEAEFKLCRVENKTTVSNGVQVALHDGSNILVKVADPKNPAEVLYETYDILRLSLPDKKVIDLVKTKVGNLAVIIGGKNIGKIGRLVEIEKTEAKKRKNALVVIEDEKGARYQTIMDFVFSIGEKEPIITEVNSVV